MSSTRLRSVSSPCPSTIAFLISGPASASAVAWKRVPIERPGGAEGQGRGHAPPVGDPARGQHRRRGRQVHHDRHEGQRGPAAAGPVPAGLGALGHDDIGPERPAACLASSRSVTWMISAAPACRMGPVNGRGSPKDNITARGRYCSARSTVPVSAAQLWNPTPQGWLVPSAATGSSRSSQARSPFPPPSRPSPPPFETAAVRAPPAVPPIGASAMGCRSENIVVNAVDNVMTPSSPGPGPEPGRLPAPRPDEILGTLAA